MPINYMDSYSCRCTSIPGSNVSFPSDEMTDSGSIRRASAMSTPESGLA